LALLSDIRIDASAALPPRASRGYWGSVLRRLLRDPVAVAAGCVILTIVLAAIFAPWIAPGDPYRGAMLRRLKRSAMRSICSAPTSSAATWSPG